LRFPILLLLMALGSATVPAMSAMPDQYAAELVAVPAGSFRMGSENGDADEKPVRPVEVADFRMGRTEVTIAWYLRCMADGACEAPSWWFIGYFEEVPAHLSPSERVNLPVTGVSWRQAMSFCAWLGPDYSLPSEAEWEYAAGAGKNRIYPWGDDPKDRYKDAPPAKRLPEAGSAKANPLGLSDMGRGVWEWVSDCYRGKPGKPCEERVSKGGSWSEHLWNLRVANKSFGLEDQGYKGLGFRVVKHAH
jgi:formylglycine-generating enzyme required for sulfatase activity